MRNEKTPKIILPINTADLPTPQEMSAARIIADFLNSDLVFLRPSRDKTPDFEIRGQIWELKSPIGNSKNTIANNFKAARKQSDNIIIDLRRCKMAQDVALARTIRQYKKRRHRRGRLLVIAKCGKVIDISKKV